jgi:hypothetical protein
MELEDLEDPKFLECVHATQPIPIDPDHKDVDMVTTADFPESPSEALRRARAHKLMRLFKEWAASQN